MKVMANASRNIAGLGLMNFIESKVNLAADTSSFICELDCFVNLLSVWRAKIRLERWEN